MEEVKDIIETANDQVEENLEQTKPEKIEKLKAWAKEHKTILQFIKFTLISMIAGLSETIVFLVLNAVIKDRTPIEALTWLYINRAPELGGFIAMTVSAIVGQVISFIVNFKKTFNSTNNIVVAAIGYAIMAFLIIFGLNCYIGSLLMIEISAAMPDNLSYLAEYIAKLICMMSSFIIVFPMNKFVIMREGKKKKTGEALENTTEETEPATKEAE